MSRATARRILLVVTGLVFLGIAAGSLLAPATMAEPFEWTLEHPNSLNEFRAIYVGLWLAHAVLFFWAARRNDLPVLGDVAALLLAGQVVGRLVSLLLDGLPDGRLLGPALAESLGALGLLLTRPR